MTHAQRWRLALRLMLREWRAGELRLLAMALLIAVGATTAIGFFADRLQRGMVQQSADVLGADLAVTSPVPLAAGWIRQARQFGLQTSEMLEFPTVILRGEALQLVSVRAVDDRFPLRGQMRVSDSLYGDEIDANTIPGTNEAWVHARVLHGLETALGDEIELGTLRLRAARVINFEPGEGGSIFGVAPRLLMRLDQVNASGIVQPGSRVQYQLLAAGPDATVRKFKQWLAPQLSPAQRMVDIYEGRPAIGNALQRAERYLGLAGLLAVVMAGVAVAMAARRYSERHFDVSAILRCLGVGQNDLLALYVPPLLLMALLAGVLGSAIGWLAQYGLFLILADIMPRRLPPAGWAPVGLGMLTALVTLTGFALPPILRLRSVPTLRVLRRELAPMPVSAWLVYGAALMGLAMLLYWHTDSVTMTVSVLLGGLVMLLLLILISIGLLKAGRVIVRRGQGRGLGPVRDGLAHLWREPRRSAQQMLAFGFTLMAMALIALVRTDLLSTWQSQLPEDAPNHFAVNILPQELDAVRRTFDAAGIRTEKLYPLVRGRLARINGDDVRQAVSKEAQADNSLHRELNLTWSMTLQQDNHITEGRWWQESDVGKPLVSVEARLARRLNIGMGDRLVFLVAGREVEAEVTSLRSVQWESFRPNFYMVFPPGVLQDLPATWMTSFHLPTAQKKFIAGVLRKFPAMSVLELDRIMEQVRRILTQVTFAVEFLLLFVLLAGFAVLFTALHASLDARLYEGALLRSLGASRRYVRRAQIAEYVSLGVLSGVLALLGTEAMTYILYSRVMQLEWTPQWWWWGILPLAGAVLVGLAGAWGTRPVLRHGPALILRRLG